MIKGLDVLLAGGMRNASVFLDTSKPQTVTKRQGHFFCHVVRFKRLVVLSAVVEQTTPSQVGLVFKEGLVGRAA